MYVEKRKSPIIWVYVALIAISIFVVVYFDNACKQKHCESGSPVFIQGQCICTEKVK